MQAELQKAINESRSIVFFGGAGVSTESGIPDFRSQDGLYSQQYDYPPEIILSHSFFLSHTEEFYRFYRNKILIAGVRPNNAHKKLAELETAGRLAGVVTQNIDGLHTAAGSRKVFELHGSIHRNTCLSCGQKYGLNYMTGCTGVPRCRCGGLIKPDVVLYEEPLDSTTLDGAVEAISAADTMIVAGTSLAVYPAAGLIEYFSGSRLIVINKTETSADRRADIVIHRPVGEVFAGIEV